MRHISYILKDEYDYLLDQKKKLEEEYKKESERKRNSCEQWAETWHDNFDFEDAELQQNLLWTRINNINHIINNTKILLENNFLNADKVTIWSTITMSVDGKEQTCVLWWHPTIPGRISYKSPLWSTLYNQKIWSHILFTHNNKSKKIIILSIN